ncbi:hypothetical protein HCN44_006772 [Aphidius gifuensis]|uniref:B box-type domain-containing protein n=1 Tax=Aphidius gifuensis TaxID=684658 RepID=A0A834Y0R9_APHGI|nr:hypothetical protein HCN44_006772 [Aphidius gifuensis]
MDPFDIRGFKTPLVRFCGHPVCESCSKKHALEPCLICGHLPRPDQANMLLPINAYVVGIICASMSSPNVVDNYADEPDLVFTDTLEAKIKKTLIFQHCIECHGEADAKCNDCPQSSGVTYFCTSCFIKYHSFNLNQHHNMISLSSENSNDKIKLDNHCHIHRNKKNTHYCKDCSTSCCEICVVEVHRAHSFVHMIDWVR